MTTPTPPARSEPPGSAATRRLRAYDQGAQDALTSLAETFEELGLNQAARLTRIALAATKEDAADD